MRLQDSPNHIAVVCHAWYQDLIGGSFRLASEFAEYLVTQGYFVSYVCCGTAEKWGNSCESGVQVFRYAPPRASMGRFRKLLYHVSESKKLVCKIHRENPLRAVSSHSPLQGLGAAKAIRRESTRVNYTVHSPFDEEFQSHRSSTEVRSLANLFATRLATWVDSRNVQLAHVVQTDSEYTQLNFRRKFGNAMGHRGITVPGWVDSRRFLPAANQGAVRTKLGILWCSDCPIFFTLRRLENRMGLETLVEAAQILKSRGYAFRVLIGGGGSLKSQLERQIAESGLEHHVFLLGRLPEEQLPLVYAAADCFVLPTKALECFGLIVLEAFACNTPVIASNVAAIPELAEQQGDGWMFEPGSAEQLADRMQAFLERRLQPTVNLREIAMKYDKANVLKEWERVLLGEARG